MFDTQDGQKVVTAQMPKHPLPGSLGSVSLIAHAITSKYVDGLPLYRIEKMLSRYGGDISRGHSGQLCDEILQQVLQPLINLLREKQNEGYIIAMDETRIQVLKEPGKSGNLPINICGSRWADRPGNRVCCSTTTHPEARLYHLTYLTASKATCKPNGYAGYNAACKKYELTSVGCMDHARRKFKEAQYAQPKGKKTKPSKADKAPWLHQQALPYRAADQWPERKGHIHA